MQRRPSSFLQLQLSAFSFQLGIIGEALSYWRGVLSKVVHIRHQASQNAKTNRPGLKTADTVYILINLKLSADALLLSVADFRMEGPSQGRIPPFVGSSSLPQERGQSIPLFRRARLFWERGQSTPLSQRARGLGCFWPIVCVGCMGVWGACACRCGVSGGGAREERRGPHSRLLSA